MASYLSILLRGESDEEARSLISLLERESRPVFEDEMPAEYGHLFNTFEDLEFPESCSVTDNELVVKWSSLKGFSFQNVLPLLKVNLLEFVLAHEIPDDPLSFDEDVEDGWYWCESADGLGYLQINKGEAIKKLGRKTVVKLRP